MMFLLLFEEFLIPWLLLIAITITVAIAVSITIAITVAVAVTMVAYISTIEDQRHILQFTSLVDILDLRQHTTVELSGTYDEDGKVGNTVGNSSIGNHTVRHVSIRI